TPRSTLLPYTTLVRSRQNMRPRNNLQRSGAGTSIIDRAPNRYPQLGQSMTRAHSNGDPLVPSSGAHEQVNPPERKTTPSTRSLRSEEHTSELQSRENL